MGKLKSQVFPREDEADDPSKGAASTKANLPPGWTRTTIVMREEHFQKLKDIAWWERASMKDVLDQILEKFFTNMKIPIPSIPKKKKILSDD